jgi:hypothetical protein
VPIVPQTAGEPASGFVVTSVAVNPQFVNVTGGSGALDEVNQIATINVGIANASETLTETVDLQVPSQVGIQPGEPTTATVTVTIEPITRLFSVSIPVPVSSLNAPSGTEVDIEPMVLNLTLAGTASQLASFNAAEVRATVNLSGLRSGTHTLTPNVVMPPEITLVDPPNEVTVTIVAPSTPTPQPSPTSTTSPTAEPTPTEEPAIDTTTPADSGTLIPTTESNASNVSTRSAESVTSTPETTALPAEENATSSPSEEQATPEPSPTASP